jgi:hypothetical protein
MNQSNIDTENSFRKNMSAAFIEENESNYSSVSTGPSFSQKSIPNPSSKTYFNVFMLIFAQFGCRKIIENSNSKG